jgi:hypothetical protein
MSDHIVVPSFQIISSGSGLDLVSELEHMQAELLAGVQAEFDRTFLEDLHNQLPAGAEHKQKILTAIGDHLHERGIDPSGVELQFAGYRVTYDGSNIVSEEWKPNE